VQVPSRLAFGGHLDIVKLLLVRDTQKQVYETECALAVLSNQSDYPRAHSERLDLCTLVCSKV
jgi:hypothetical protein